MDKLTIDDIDLREKRVLVRVDFNVPLEKGVVTDDTRIRASLPTIQKLLQANAKVLLMSHLGRPKGGPDPKYSLMPAANRLTQLLGRNVEMAPDCVGPEVERMVAAMKPGDLLMLENVRFHPEEEKNDPAFAKQLAALAEVYVNDAFGSAHRAHASTEGVAKILKNAAVAGYLMKAEISALGKMLGDPPRPYVAILGGAKVSDKIDVIHTLITKVSHLLIGGGMAYTFLKAQGHEIGNSLLEEDKLAVAKNVLRVAEYYNPRKPLRLELPDDHIIASSLEGDDATPLATVDIPAGKLAGDIGPKTLERYRTLILQAKTILWNGPMGVFEKAAFAAGTMGIARAVAEATSKGAFSVVGGGDSVAALAQSGLTDKISHVSTGGGASLEFLGGKDLPGVVALTKAPAK
ncbi:MAG: phosphoglycerate kinase [candidate division KSB1 bacterium]|nr:phosphoglycerate kinase [candidate division KSB1 bacterium]MDZ7274628.1 phosphoglycerate kinase [candidate division KSB1 bacterium]MDZ7285453.1 phosphoglycerate kinase [candidate division KSB1 bacterium]MDZ7298485.1 phosphoglycerate kinase [candidate division KSB1 bacterium]MDZ7306969.1 phosphoglycerate kinase [candidate division KSB1 bacterium]